MTTGEVVCELDSSTLKEQAKQQEIGTTQAEAAMATAREALEIQKTQNDSDIAAATLKAELAKLDLEKYEEGEYRQLKQQHEGDVKIAEEELIRAKETMLFTASQVKKGYASQNELNASRIAVQQAELKLRGAEELLNVLQNFTYKRTIAELKANALESERELARVRLKAASAQTQREKDADATRLTYDVEREKLMRLQNQIDACTIRAPQDGEVVYANMSSAGRRSDSIPIEAGATVRERQAIINLPDVTQMKVDCRIHESLIGAVRRNLPARVRVDAYPDDIYSGLISHVSSVPMSGSWPNTDLREYQTEVQLTDTAEKIRRLRPGLTSQVEILVDNRSDVLQVPIQSIVNVHDKQIVYVYSGTTPERRFVKLGAANQSHLEVLEGVSEGERIIMNPRSQFGDQIAALEAELNAAAPKKDPLAVIPAQDPAERPKPAPGAGAAGETTASPTDRAPGNDTPSGPPPGGNFFARLDKNQDGAVTIDEAPEEMKSRFASLDKNGDGKLTREELSAGRPPRPN